MSISRAKGLNCCKDIDDLNITVNFQKTALKKWFYFRLPVVAERKKRVAKPAVLRDSCISTLSLLPCPSGRHHFKSARGLDVWKLCYTLYLQNLWFILVKKLATFCIMSGAFFPHGNLSLFWEFLNWSANESKTLSLPDQSLVGTCWCCRPGEWGVEAHIWRFGRKWMVF